MKNARLLPIVEDARKRSTLWCNEIFDDLNETLNLIQAGSFNLNKTQRVLLERFCLLAVEFAHDLLLAEGHEEEVQRRLAVSGKNMNILFSSLPAMSSARAESTKPDTSFAINLYDEVLDELRRIKDSAVKAIRDDTVACIQSVVDERSDASTLEVEACDSLAGHVSALVTEIETSFRVRENLIEIVKTQYVIKSSTNLKSENRDGKAN